MFDSFHFSTAMDTHLLTPEELVSKQQEKLKKEQEELKKKQEELRQKALKNAHDLEECVRTTCVFCILEKKELEKIEQERLRKDALDNAHYSFPKTCDPNTCVHCINERLDQWCQHHELGTYT